MPFFQSHTPRRTTCGFASLPVVLLLGGIIIEAAIAGAFILYYVNSNIYADRLDAQVTVLARSAVDDAIRRVTLNPNCGIDQSGCPSPYTITTSGATASVTICKDTCAGADITQISVIARALNKEHHVTALLNVSSTLPLVSVRSISDTIQ